MLAPLEHDQAKRPEEPAGRTDISLDRKSAAEPNPFWRSLALASADIQPKLTVSNPSDADEHEADRIADQVMGSPRPSDAAPPIATQGDGSAGQRLEPETRAFFESRFGRDFSRVRVHTGGDAAEAARGVRARAFTIGPNVVFGHNQFAPATSEGRRLIAHELAHVVQRRSAASETNRISRSPLHGTGTQALHEELVEEYRRANGLPPHGVDPSTGQQIGPTDAEIRFGGLLDAWLLANRPKNVPAPAQAPTIVGPGGTNVVAACRGAPDVGACLRHRTYVLNILPQAIANIRAVRSPYSAAIADLYAAVLPAAQTAAAPIPPGSPSAPYGRSVDAPGGSVTVTFGATRFTFNQFTVSLQQQGGGVNGRALGVGGPVGYVFLNETSNDALLSNLAGIEATMTHETMHIFMEIVEGLNRGRTAGTPVVDPNLDRTSYATLQSTLENALLPFITQIRQLPGLTSAPTGSAQRDAALTASTFLSEAIARTEAGIFVKQRAGQAFGAADLRALPPFFHAPDYWSPSPPPAFIQTNQAQIDAAIQPIIDQIGQRYLNLRP